MMLLNEAMMVKSKLQWRFQDVGGARTMINPSTNERCRHRVNHLKKWSHTLRTRTRGQTVQGCWCPGDSITRPKCQTWSCSIWFFFSAFRVLIWPNISFLGSYSSLLKLNVYSVQCILEKDNLLLSLLFKKKKKNQRLTVKRLPKSQKNLFLNFRMMLWDH